ncbi:MAG: N(4)-(beta-N-acetylglucosaminyl)-L-asparaginase [Planctomycetota bacterium]|jgi:isoaspartyl peptidase/L-asparaginase-like protein (Ntn-hydrolase superfamily)
MGTGIGRRDFLKRAAATGLAATVPGPLRAAPAHRAKGPVVISTWRHGVAANAAAWEVLTEGGSALDAVEAGVRVSEADPAVTSVGRGGLPNEDGIVQLDAAIMDGTTREAGSVASLEDILHPISVARLVMEKTRHVMLVGPGARKFALANGHEKTNLLTDRAKAAWEKWNEKREKQDGKDTIGMVALDKAGKMAAACTTSGLRFKMAGRVGDSPIIGCGLYADGAAGGASATGVGEEVIKVCGSFLVTELMRGGASPEAACRTAVDRILERDESNRQKQIAFIALRPDGSFGAASMGKRFQMAVHDADGGRLLDIPASHVK